MRGDVPVDTATASPEGLKATPKADPIGAVAGSTYLPPKPDDVQEYAVMDGVPRLATAIDVADAARPV